MLYVQNRCAVMPHLFENIENVEYQEQYDPSVADVVFLAGMDWKHYLPHQAEHHRVINLIQHVRHADPDLELFGFLKQKALRICVSDAVRDAIAPYANGECITIPMGHSIPTIVRDKELELYILGRKNPDFANRMDNWAKEQGIKTKTDTGLVDRKSVFENFARSKVSLVLPHSTEGFFLPGIEAMALSDVVVVPDCIANREYCLPETNITRCDYTETACQNAILDAQARLLSPAHAYRKFRGERLARSYSLTAERDAYRDLLTKRLL